MISRLTNGRHVYEAAVAGQKDASCEGKGECMHTLEGILLDANSIVQSFVGKGIA